MFNQQSRLISYSTSLQAGRALEAAEYFLINDSPGFWSSLERYDLGNLRSQLSVVWLW